MGRHSDNDKQWGHSTSQKLQQRLLRSSIPALRLSKQASLADLFHSPVSLENPLFPREQRKLLTSGNQPGDLTLNTSAFLVEIKNAFSPDNGTFYQTLGAQFSWQLVNIAYTGGRLEALSSLASLLGGES